MFLGNFKDRIIVVQNVVSDKRGLVSLMANKKNQGGTHVNEDTGCTVSKCVQAIYMDDLATLASRHFRSQRAMIKVGINGRSIGHFKMSY